MKNIADTAVIVTCGLALLAAMAAAHAQELADPTRPPTAPDNAGGAPGAAAPASGLQAIIRREGARPAALINGEYVELGAKSGDARVVAIGEDSVTLNGPAGREVLKLLPGAEKTPAAAGRSDKKGAGRSKAGEGSAK